jgi:hypothetical protein
MIGEKFVVLIPRYGGKKFSSKFFFFIFFSGGVSRFAATPLILCLSPGHTNIIRFHPWSSLATGNLLDRAEKIKKLLRQLSTLRFLTKVQVFQDPLRGELPQFQIFMNDGPNSIM